MWVGKFVENTVAYVCEMPGFQVDRVLCHETCLSFV